MTMTKFKTYQLAIQFYRNSQKLHLKEPLKNQFQRAILSIVLNLAEGSVSLKVNQPLAVFGQVARRLLPSQRLLVSKIRLFLVRRISLFFT